MRTFDDQFYITLPIWMVWPCMLVGSGGRNQGDSGGHLAGKIDGKRAVMIRYSNRICSIIN
uniref:Uncharacterized protein n=1 Tax=Romanomermis culicivorax TaxID=13658 RepID=A0A915IAM1_ROMCU